MNYEILNWREWIPSPENLPDITRRITWSTLAIIGAIESYNLGISQSYIVNGLAGLTATGTAYNISPTQKIIDFIGFLPGGLLAGGINTIGKIPKIPQKLEEIVSPFRRR